MDVLCFDEARLVSHLETLPKRSRVVFAALCGERQLANYENYLRGDNSINLDTLESALAMLFEDAVISAMHADEITLLLNKCVSLIPSELDDASEEAAYADDAVGSVAYAIRTQLTGSAQEAAWAARRAYEAVDRFATTQLSLTGYRGSERAILSSPVVQAELKRQEEDLRDLEKVNAEKKSAGTLTGILRDRARTNSRNFLSIT